MKAGYRVVMKIYVIASQSAATAPGLSSSIMAEYNEDVYKLQSDVWLVAGHGTAKDVCLKLKITSDQEPDPTKTVAVVFPTDGYYGRADPALWQWIQSRLARKNDGQQ